ncbi:hypothetical protein M3Y97_00314600 [Aphelenchoides bicaudatus]|nr:hypothetical protein M3Y97_00314600 [Aphelenchoides bicaudatus]
MVDSKDHKMNAIHISKMSSTKVSQLPLPTLPPDKKETPWKSIITCGIICVCQAIQFSLYFSSLWPYLQLLDASVTENFFGYVTSAYSIGQIVSAPLVGIWSTKLKSIVLPSQCSLLFVFIGNAIYFTAALHGKKYGALIGRLFVGLGAGNMSMMQSYASMSSVPADRSRAIAIITGGVSLGMCVGPGLQLLFTPLGYPGIYIYKSLYLNMYTAPALTCCVVNLLMPDFANEKGKKKEDRIKVEPYDKLAVFLCHFTRFTQLFTWTNLETIGPAFAMSVFAISRDQTVKWFATSHLILGFLSLFIYLLFIVIKMEKHCDFRKICISGLLGFVLFHVVTYSWPFLPGSLKTYSNEEYNLYLNGTVKTEPVGCPIDRFEWCQTLSPVNIWVFFFMFILTVGGFWSEINISLSTILSQILGPRQQTNQQSLYYSAGAMARLSGPVIISNLYTSFGPRFGWIIQVGLLTFTISMWFIFYKRMVPLVNDQAEKNEVEKIEKLRVQPSMTVHNLSSPNDLSTALAACATTNALPTTEQHKRKRGTVDSEHAKPASHCSLIPVADDRSKHLQMVEELTELLSHFTFLLVVFFRLLKELGHVHKKLLECNRHV